MDVELTTHLGGTPQEVRGAEWVVQARLGVEEAPSMLWRCGQGGRNLPVQDVQSYPRRPCQRDEGQASAARVGQHYLTCPT